jgi:hypothetical protein
MEKRQARPVDDAVLDLLKVELEKFGSFPEGFGDNGTSDKHDEGQGGENDSRVISNGDSEHRSANLSKAAIVSTESDSLAIPAKIDSMSSLIDPLHTPADSTSPEEVYTVTAGQGSMETLGDFGILPMINGQSLYSDEALLAYLMNEHTSSLAPYSVIYQSPNFTSFNLPPNLDTTSTMAPQGLQHFISFAENSSHNFQS